MREKWRDKRVVDGMKMLTVAATAALLAASPAAASTLILYDVDANYGSRLPLTPLLEQEFARNTRTGVARPIVVPVNDDGSERTVALDVAAPVPLYPLGPGQRVQRGRVTWQVTTSLSNRTLSFRNVISRVSVYTDGVTLSAPTTSRTEIAVNGSLDAAGPVIATRYDAPGGARMIIGFLKP